MDKAVWEEWITALYEPGEMDEIMLGRAEDHQERYPCYPEPRGV
mgnify:CR=1 FL=1